MHVGIASWCAARLVWKQEVTETVKENIETKATGCCNLTVERAAIAASIFYSKSLSVQLAPKEAEVRRNGQCWPVIELMTRLTQPEPP